MSPLNTDPESVYKSFTTPRNAANRASFKSLSELLGEGKLAYETAKPRKSSPRLIANHNKINEEIDEADVIIKKAA